jgi:hypothetical protein
MLSESLWQRKFGGAAGIIGKTILLNSGTFSVAGIAPRGFRGAGLQVVPSDIWIPFSAADVSAPGTRVALMRRVSPADPAALAAGVAVVVVVTLAAAHLPTRRAMSVDPMTALRNE